MQPHIAHDGYNDLVMLQLPFLRQGQGAQTHDLIAIYRIALFVHRQQAVGVPVKGQA
ncbi:hypothetical protein SDC9_211843 [bioreactor metagenome]|uniref:Uncharacterized protein n=1 Tax=bioreactor metagenome TaxID=1076179 RepID=A0A645JLD1_9ZZZZ